MKKIVLVAFLVLSSAVTFAQDAFKKDVLEMMKVSGVNASMDAAKKQVVSMIPADKQAEFTKEFDAILAKVADQQAKNYMEVYTHDDIKAMLKFYESPVGKKIQEKASILTEKSMEIQQNIGMEIQGLMMKYMQ
mgnify:CR=1 FL=1